MPERARSTRLREYRRKRAFGATTEPDRDGREDLPSGAPKTGEGRKAGAWSTGAGRDAGAGRKTRARRTTRGGRDAGADELRFVVHEHHARRLHWDLRLEHDGALASWAIPNGIPEDPRHNRKAIHVEDHPLDYLDFTGTIPAGSYGAGEVSVWDSGTYTCEKWRPEEVIVVFSGERLRGRYALFQAGRDERDWLIHRMDPPPDPTAREMPDFVQPMLARLSVLPEEEGEEGEGQPEDGRDEEGGGQRTGGKKATDQRGARQGVWAYEVKWDGVRAIARSEPGRIVLVSRNGNDITAAYPELRALNRQLGSRSAMLDGEIIAFDAAGHPAFEALQPRMHQRGERAIRRLMRTTPVTYVIFDLLWLDGHSLIDLPYAERRARLQELELNGEHWRTPPYHAGPGEGRALFRATREQDLEGVVAKRLDSRYLPGGRTGAWLKIKHHNRQEVVIGGWNEGRRARAGRIGALDLGVYDEHGALRYAGQVGTGWDERELERLESLLEGLARDDSPFSGRQPPRTTHYVSPELVCEVEFSEWTQAGQLRQASYKGLRTDKPAREVVREWVQTAPRTMGVPVANGDLFQSARRIRGGIEVEVEGRTLRLTNLDKVMYPQTGFTKGDVIGYYAAIAPVLVPHLRDRPLTLKRCPDGIEEEHFYEKQCPGHRPEWVQTTAVWSGHSDREIDYCVCQDLPTLVWLANLAAIELHPSLSRAGTLACPTAMVFDLDPGASAGLVECCEVALHIRDMLAELGLATLAKTSGVKGMQVYLPLNRDPPNDVRHDDLADDPRDDLPYDHPNDDLADDTRDDLPNDHPNNDRITYDQTKPFARAVAELLAHRHPKLVTATMAKSQRPGRVFIDWSQNDEHKTTVSVYSLRATPSPMVSAPLQWEEVETCRDTRAPAPLQLGPDQVLTRARERGDLFGEAVSLTQTLPELG